MAKHGAKASEKVEKACTRAGARAEKWFGQEGHEQEAGDCDRTFAGS